MIRRALKEWDAACRALATGRACVLVRKAGILDPEGPLEAGAAPFALFPTFEHQKPERLRPDLSMLVRPDPEDGRAATMELVATAVEERLVTDADLLDPIADLHVLTKDGVLDRIAYGRKRGVRAILVRVARLTLPVRIEMTEEVRGCVSWVPLEEEIEGSAGAVLEDGAFEEARRRFTSALPP